MAATAIAFPQSAEWTTERSPNGFGEGYLARLRGGDDETLRHFNDHFRRLIRLKLWGQFSPERAEELANDVIAAARQKILDGEPADANRLPAYILRMCSTLAARQTAPPAERRNARFVTREQLRLFFLRRKAGQPTGR